MNRPSLFNTAAVAGAAMLGAVAANQDAEAGSTNPGTYSNHVVGGNSSNNYYETLRAGDDTVITLNGYCPSSRQDIDLWVYDSRNRQVAKSTSRGCFERVAIWPDYTQTYRIRVENTGKPYATEYDLTTD